MKKSDILIGAVLLLVVIGTFALMAVLSTSAHNTQERNDRFAGACALLDGKVADDLCVKDDKVVLTKKEFENG